MKKNYDSMDKEENRWFLSVFQLIVMTEGTKMKIVEFYTG